MADPGSRFPLTPDTTGKTLQIISPGQDKDPIHVIIYKTEEEALEQADSNSQQGCATTRALYNQAWNSLPSVKGGPQPVNTQSRGTRRRFTKAKTDQASKRVKTFTATGTPEHLACKENHSSKTVYISSNNVLPLNAIENTTLPGRQAVVPAFSSRGPLTLQQSVTEHSPQAVFTSHVDRSNNIPVEAVLHNHRPFTPQSISMSEAASPKASWSATQLLHRPVATSTPVSKNKRTTLQEQAMTSTKSSQLLRLKLQEKLRNPQNSQSGSPREQPLSVTPSSSPALMSSDSGLSMTPSTTPSGFSRSLSTPLPTSRQRMTTTTTQKSLLAPSTPLSMSGQQQSGGSEGADRDGKTSDIIFPRTPSLGQASGKWLSPEFGCLEQSPDSGFATLMTPSQVQGEAGLDADMGATCSSWGMSDDSNHPLPELPLDENSNSQDDGDMNKSLTGMVWLSQYTPSLPNKAAVMTTSRSQDPSPNSGTLLRSRMCSCGNKLGEPEKPEKNYKTLIGSALLSRQDCTMTPKQIRTWFIENIPYFKFHEKCGFWQNAIRHNLSSNDCFIKNQIKKKHWTLDLRLLQESTESRDTRNRPHPPPLARTRSVDSMVLRPVGQQLLLGYSNITNPTNLFFNNSLPRTAFMPILPRTSLPNPIPFLPRGQMLLVPGDKPLMTPAPLSSTPALPKLPIPPLVSTAMSTATSSSTRRNSGWGSAASKGKKSQAPPATGKIKKLRKAKSVGSCGKDMLLCAAIQSGLTTGEGLLDEQELSEMPTAASSSPSPYLTLDSIPVGLPLLEPGDGAGGQVEAAKRRQRKKRCASTPATPAPQSEPSSSMVTSQQVPPLEERTEAGVPSANAQAPSASSKRPARKKRPEPGSLSGKMSEQEDSVSLNLCDVHASLTRGENPMLTQGMVHSPLCPSPPYYVDTSTPVSKSKGREMPLTSPIHQLCPESEPFVLEDLSYLLAENVMLHMSPEVTPRRRKCPTTPDTAAKQKDNLTTPPSSSLKNFHTWPPAIDSSLTLDLVEPQFGHLLELPDDLSCVDQSVDAARTSGAQETGSGHMQGRDGGSRDWTGSGGVQQASTGLGGQSSKEGPYVSTAMLHPTSSAHTTLLHTDLTHIGGPGPSNPLSRAVLHMNSADGHQQCSLQPQPQPQGSEGWHQPCNVTQQSLVGSWHQQPNSMAPSCNKDWQMQQPSVALQTSGRSWHRPQGLEVLGGEKQGGRPCLEEELLYRDKPPPSDSGGQPVGLVMDQQFSSLQQPVRTRPPSSTTTWYCPPAVFPSKNTGPQSLAAGSLQSSSSPTAEKTSPSGSSIRRSLLPQLAQERTLSGQSMESFHSSGMSDQLQSVPQQQQQSALPTSSGGQYVHKWPGSIVSQQNKENHHVLCQQQPPLLSQTAQALTPHLATHHQAAHATSVSSSASVSFSVNNPVVSLFAQNVPTLNLPQQSAQVQSTQPILSSSPSNPLPLLAFQGQPWHPSMHAQWAQSEQHGPAVRNPSQQVSYQPMSQQLQLPQHAVQPQGEEDLLVYPDLQVRLSQPPAVRLESQSPLFPLGHQSQQSRLTQQVQENQSTYQAESSVVYQLHDNQTLGHREQTPPMYQAQQNPEVYQAPPNQPQYQAGQNVAVYQSPQSVVTHSAHQTSFSEANLSFSLHCHSPQAVLASAVAAQPPHSPREQRMHPGMRDHLGHSAFPTPVSSTIPSYRVGERGLQGGQTAQLAGSRGLELHETRFSNGGLTSRHQVSQPRLLSRSPSHLQPLPPHLRSHLSPSLPVQFPPPSSYSSSVLPPSSASGGNRVKQELQFLPSCGQGSVAVRQAKLSSPYDLLACPPLFMSSSGSAGQSAPLSFPSTHSVTHDNSAGLLLFSAPSPGVSLSSSPSCLRTISRSESAVCASAPNMALPCRPVSAGFDGSVQGFSSTSPASASFSGGNATCPFDLFSCETSADCFPVGVDSGRHLPSLQTGVSDSPPLHMLDSQPFGPLHQTSASAGVGSQGGGGNSIQKDGDKGGDKHRAVPSMLNLTSEQRGALDPPPSLPDTLLTNCGASLGLGASASGEVPGLTHYGPDYPSFFAPVQHSSSSSYSSQPTLSTPQPHHRAPVSAVDRTGSVLTSPVGSLAVHSLNMDTHHELAVWQADDFLDSLMSSPPPPSKQLPHS